MSTKFATIVAAAAIIAAGTVPAICGAAASPHEIRFQNHRFAPQTLSVPANQPLTIKVTNASAETIEFESFKLNREIAMTPGEAITVHLPALDPGNYDFYDDFHQDVPQGSIVAK
ncbi:MAG: cupredoxin domain-containing protein [Candidatus Binataceae bacterium]